MTRRWLWLRMWAAAILDGFACVSLVQDIPRSRRAIERSAERYRRYLNSLPPEHPKKAPH